jgi:L-lactate dehydrogenase complex protein LldF
MNGPQSFNVRAHDALSDTNLQSALAKAGGGFIHKRQTAASAEPDFERMRDQAKEVRERSLRDLDIYIQHFESQVTRAGGQVHWAESVEDLRRIVLDICRESGARHATKGKSMVSEEAHLNQALEEAGITPWETDLGEYILQLAKEPPSHIVAPALHKTKAQIEQLFRQAHDLGERDLEAVKAIVDEARAVIRDRFLSADVGITGANLLIAETGTAMLATNEGNGDLTASLPKTHIITTSFDRVVPSWDDAAKIMRVLARSATGQPVTSYTSFFSAPGHLPNSASGDSPSSASGDSPNQDGPENFHVVLLDNRRTHILGSEYREMLHCIRCGACMNHCPVYQTVGGHAYDSVYPGPMGAVLSPLIRGKPQDYELANASTFCGRCEEVCPVRIPLPKLLRYLRDEEQQKYPTGPVKRISMSMFTALATRPRLYRVVTNFGGTVLRLLSGRRGRIRRIPGMGAWTKQRDLPAPAKDSFQTRWQRQHDDKKDSDNMIFRQ